VTRVLYVVGWGRSGTTVLGNVVAQYPGATTVGELRALWQTPSSDLVCGCGLTIRSCPQWAEALDEFRKDLPLEGVPSPRLRRFPSNYLRTRTGTPLARSLRRHGDTRSRLYRTIAAGTGSGVIIDTSKVPTDALPLIGRQDLDLFLLHIVRDPDATAESWATPKADRAPNGAAALMPTFGPAFNAANWVAFNVGAELLARLLPGDRHRLVTYERFVASPRQVTSELAQWLGLPVDRSPFVTDRRVELAPTHTVGGNPDRFSTGIIAIDVRSRLALPRRRPVATRLTAALSRRYGYASRGRR
jgi:hypothetical protein